MKLVEPLVKKELELVADLSVFDDDIDSLEAVLIDGVSFVGFSLQGLTITGSRIVKSDFSSAKLEGLGFENVVVESCAMLAARFHEASWHTTTVTNSRCSGVQLDQSTLKNVAFRGCKLDMANFRYAKLNNVIFEDCVVNEMDFGSAELKNVTFAGCAIDGIDFTHAKLQNVDLRGSMLAKIKRPSDLKGVIITSEQLIYLAPQLAHEAGIKVED